MEYHVKISGRAADFQQVEAALLDLDPGAVVDLAQGGTLLRVSALLGREDVLGALARAGVQASPDDLHQVPSTCCGSCSS